MALRLILGRAGTGKTQLCLAALRAQLKANPLGPPLILLVPEQATFQMEQALFGSDSGLSGMIRAQVLSFKRLAWRLSQRTGGLALPPLSDLGKQMVLRALLERRTPDLKIFGLVADRPGFIERLSGTISEMRMYNLDPTAIQGQVNAMADKETPIGSKLHDLALVMEDLTSYTAGRFTDPDDYLTVLAKCLPDSGLFDGAEVWIDSFSGFTPQELAVLGSILSSARQVNLTLCVDPGDVVRRQPKARRDPSQLFHPTLSTYDQVIALSAERNVVVDPALVLDTPHRYASSPGLAIVERALLSHGATVPSPEAAQGISLIEAPNRRLEVAAAAREILRLVREDGLRYREISVVARNLDAYGDLAATVLAEHGIPVFVDRRRSVAHHPVVELLRASLEVVIHDWAYGPVFRLLKTDLAQVSRGEVDTLENYVIEHGIRGRRWHDDQPWAFVRRYTLEAEEAISEGQATVLDRINKIRRQATTALAAFQRRVGGGRGGRAQTVRSISTALYHLLEEMQIARQVGRWSAEAEAAGDLEAAREHEQVWDGVIDLFDQLVEALGDATMSVTQYLQVLSAGLDSMRVGLIPPGMDQVMVGTAERSRHAQVQATLILGATEKDFPPLPPEDAIFNDKERERLDQDGLGIGPTSLDRLFQEQFFTYLALTRGSRLLWISHPTSDDSGRGMTPSPVIRRLQRLFPELKSQPSDPQPEEVSGIATPGHFAAALTRQMRQHRSGYPLDPVWLDLYQWATDQPDLRERLAPVIAAVSYEERYARQLESFGSDLATELYGLPLVTSVSRLESFAACPFQHFAGYGLRLRERGRFQISAPELGLFYHAAMSLFVRKLQTDRISWADLSPDDAGLIMDGLVDQLAPRLQSEILLSGPQQRYVLRVMRRTLHASLRSLSDHVHHGGFRPLWVELPFGEAPENGGLPALEIPLDSGGLVQLRGRIDRVDGMQKPNGEWLLRVLDYKSSPRPLDMGQFYHALSLQLMLYLQAVVTHSPILLGVQAQPAGALYFPVHDPLERLAHPESPEEIAKRIRKRYTAKGLIHADPQVIRAMDMTGMGLTQARINNDGSVRRGSPVATTQQFQHLFAHVDRMVQQSAGRLLHGELAVAPYRLGAATPCQYCRMRPVCQFDPMVKGQGYRSLEPIKRDEIWPRIQPESGGDA